VLGGGFMKKMFPGFFRRIVLWWMDLTHYGPLQRKQRKRIQKHPFMKDERFNWERRSLNSTYQAICKEYGGKYDSYL
jgi:hypothetical protein